MTQSIRTNIGERLAEGRQILRAKYKELDAAKLGVLRAGNSGIMSIDGEVAGSCHRVAHLRQLGIELDPPDDKQLVMFQLGVSNEQVVYDDLVQTSAPGEVILREEEIPIEWFTTNGTKVSGRPDMVICKSVSQEVVTGKLPEEGTRFVKPADGGGLYKYVVPILALELKSVASVWTTRSVLFEGDPKLAHLAQVAHYMWKLGTPGRLIYKQYANQAMPDFAHRYFPRQGATGSEYLEYGKDGKPKCIRPFEIVYELEFTESGHLRFRREDQPEGVWCQTIVSKQDIERFYEYVSQMGSEQVLGQRPLTLGWDGEAKRYSNCDFCKLDSTCDKVAKMAGTKKVTGSTEAEKYLYWLSEARKLVDIRGEKK